MLTGCGSFASVPTFEWEWGQFETWQWWTEFAFKFKKYSASPVSGCEENKACPFCLECVPLAFSDLWFFDEVVQSQQFPSFKLEGGGDFLIFFFTFFNLLSFFDFFSSLYSHLFVLLLSRMTSAYLRSMGWVARGRRTLTWKRSNFLFSFLRLCFSIAMTTAWEITSRIGVDNGSLRWEPHHYDLSQDEHY